MSLPGKVRAEAARRSYQVLRLVGIDVKVTRDFVRGLPFYLRSVAEYRTASKNLAEERFPLRLGVHFPVLGDRSDEAGTVGGDYFHQDLWAARHIHGRRPARHLDVGSRLDGFVAQLLVFMPVEVIDVRPLNSKVAGLKFTQDDATSLASIPDDSLESVSSLHAVEHFGLGRYGDAINPGGWRDAMLSLGRVLAPGGRLYFSVPIGRERLVFNAHRIFDPVTVVNTFGKLRLVSFAAVTAAGDLDENVTPEEAGTGQHSCGLFEFTKD